MNTLLIKESNKHIYYALYKNKKLFSIWVHDKESPSLIGSIYNARITKIEPSISSAFLELEPELPAFLFEGDVLEIQEKKLEQKAASIKNTLEINKPLLVQVKKDPLEIKSIKVTTQIALPGIFLVLLPLNKKKFIKFSKKIIDEKLKEKFQGWAENKNIDGSIIFRSSLIDGADVDSDLETLKSTWKNLQKKITSNKKGILYNIEPIDSLLMSLLSYKIDSIITNSTTIAKKFSLHLWSNYYASPQVVEVENLLKIHDLDLDIKKILRPTVWLPSGSYLVIEETAAGTTIDVNTGKQMSKEDPENFIFKVNTEAAIEAVRQIRLRNQGGIIFIDFIDMQDENHKELLIKTLRESFAEDNIYTEVFPMSPLGVVEVSRKRTGLSLQKLLKTKCPHCSGQGRIN